MKLTTKELIKLVETHYSKEVEFENKIKDNTDIEDNELEEYTANRMIVLLCAMKLKDLNIDEMLEKYLNNLHK